MPLICDVKKGTIIAAVRMETMAAEGKCVARHDGQVIFVTGCAPGDIADVEVLKVRSNFLEARLSRMVTPSPDRATPFCQHFGLCGGCSWQHIQYAHQLQFKQQQVIDNLTRLGGLELPEITPILPSENFSRYRNRLDFTFTAFKWVTREALDAGAPLGQPGLGFHIPRMYDRVFDVETCHLMPSIIDDIRNMIRDLAIENQIPFFDLRKQVGFLRTLTIRSNVDGELMIILQVAYPQQEWIDLLLGRLAEKFPQAVSINFIVNGKRNDTFHDLDIQLFRGSPWLTERMRKPDKDEYLQFRVGPKSFYQTNGAQAARLYRVAWELAELKGNELVYDLYTGTGTIANYVAGSCAYVIGLEYVAAAIEDAKLNADLNGVKNAEFFAGDMKDLLNDDFVDRHGRPDVVITDPPRAGMHEDVVKMLLKVSPEKIVYVSCNPATQARDLKLLSEAYRISAVRPVDMFPQTMHVENVVALVRR